MDVDQISNKDEKKKIIIIELVICISFYENILEFQFIWHTERQLELLISFK